MKPENKLYFIEGSLFMTGDNGRELQIHVNDEYFFNKLYTITNSNIINIEENNPHYFFELYLDDISKEIKKMVYDRYYFEDIMDYLATFGDEDEIAQELEQIALRGPIRNVEIYLDDYNKINIIEHRDLGEMDYITGFDDNDYFEYEEYSGNLKKERRKKMDENKKEIIEEEEEEEVKTEVEEKEDDSKLVKEEKKPKENVIKMEMETENKKKEAK